MKNKAYSLREHVVVLVVEALDFLVVAVHAVYHDLFLFAARVGKSRVNEGELCVLGLFGRVRELNQLAVKLVLDQSVHVVLLKRGYKKKGHLPCRSPTRSGSQSRVRRCAWYL